MPSCPGDLTGHMTFRNCLQAVVSALPATLKQPCAQPSLQSKHLHDAIGFMAAGQGWGKPFLILLWELRGAVCRTVGAWRCACRSQCSASLPSGPGASGAGQHPGVMLGLCRAGL